MVSVADSMQTYYSTLRQAGYDHAFVYPDVPDVRQVVLFLCCQTHHKLYNDMMPSLRHS